FDMASLRSYYGISRPEFIQSVTAMIGVMSVGVLPGIFIAVMLALLRLIYLASRPHDAVLVPVDLNAGTYCHEEEKGGKPVAGLLIYRFDSALVFFNADRFKERVLALCNRTEAAPKWLLFDAEAVSFVDITGAAALNALCTELSGQGTVLAIARAKSRFRNT